MGATVVAMAVGEKQVAIAHAGDSRAYRLREGEFKKLTRDHSIAEEMRAARPEMTEEELMASPTGTSSCAAWAARTSWNPTSTSTRWRRATSTCCARTACGLGADGKITEILNSTSDVEAACQLLVDAANEAGGPDNVTVLLVRLG
jgi:protein phosphatase